MATQERRIVLPGGSGYLGRHLARRLTERGDDVVVLTRGVAGHRAGIRYVHWDARTLGPWVTELDGAHAVVHLSGKRVDTRPTRRNVDELVRSRVEAVRVVGEALTGVATPPAVWVQVGTLAIFGEGGDEILAEDAVPPGVGPRQMVSVALVWEQAYEVASAPVQRRVLLRCGIALGPDDPALALTGRRGHPGRLQQEGAHFALPRLEDAVHVALEHRR